MNEITIKIEGLQELAEAVRSLAKNASAQDTAPVPQASAVPQTQAENPGVFPAPVQTAVPITTAAAPAAPVQPEAATEQIQSPAPVPTAPTAVPTSETPYTLDDLARAAMTLMDAGKQQDLVTLLNTFGVEALPVLPKAQYGAFATALRGLGARI